MPVNRVAIEPDLIAWAIDRSGIAVEVLETKFSKLGSWIRGELQPTLKQVEQLAAATRTPFGYFFLPTPPEEHLPIPHFRTVADARPRRPSPDLIETLHLMQQRQAWMREHLIEEQEPPLPFAASTRIDADTNIVATSIRDTLGLSSGWAAQHDAWESALRGLQSKIEGAGILVVANGVVGNNNFRKLDVKEFRGFVLADEYAPLVFVNAADAKAAQMFTLIH